MPIHENHWKIKENWKINKVDEINKKSKKIYRKHVGIKEKMKINRKSVRNYRKSIEIYEDDETIGEYQWKIQGQKTS